MIGVASKCDDDQLAREFFEMFFQDTYYMSDFCQRNNIFMNSHTAASSYQPYSPYMKHTDFNKWLVKSADNIDISGRSIYDNRISIEFSNVVRDYVNDSYFSMEEALNDFKRNVIITYPDLSIY